MIIGGAAMPNKQINNTASWEAHTVNIQWTALRKLIGWDGPAQACSIASYRYTRVARFLAGAGDTAAYQAR